MRIAALFPCLAITNDSDWCLAPTIKSVDRIDKRGARGVVLGNRNGQQFAFPAVDKGVEDPQGKHVIDVATDIRIEYDWKRAGALLGACRN